MGSPGELTDEAVLRAGHWNRRYTRVLATYVAGELAAAVLDTHVGGMPYPYVETFRWSAKAGWESVGGGDAGLGGEGWDQTNRADDEDAGGVAHAWGTAPDKTEVLVEFGSERHRVKVQRDGWWVFAVEAPTSNVMPQRVD